jgi:hypothetical protein
MKAYGEWTYIDPHFLDLSTSWREWLASHPGRFIPGTSWIGGWVDPRAGLDDMEKRKFLTLPGLNHSVNQSVASHYTDYAIPIYLNLRM